MYQSTSLGSVCILTLRKALDEASVLKENPLNGPSSVGTLTESLFSCSCFCVFLLIMGEYRAGGEVGIDLLDGFGAKIGKKNPWNLMRKRK